jgi:pimeloyl-ACP methyl ester carboxylesterase
VQITPQQYYYIVYTLEKFTTRINGLTVAYHKFGSGEPLLFLHGGRTHARTYRKLLLHLSKNHTVLAPDIPGYGQSDTPSVAWSFIEYALFMDDLLKRLGIEKTTVVGHSMGGGIAAVLASTSDKVSRLILIDAAGVRGASGEGGPQDLRRLWFYGTHPQHAGSCGTLLFALVQFIWKHRLDWSATTSTRYKCFTTPYEDYLRNIQVPTQLIWGDRDWVYPLDIARAYQEQIPNSELVIVSGNHDWPIYNPLLLTNAEE